MTETPTTPFQDKLLVMRDSFVEFLLGILKKGVPEIVRDDEGKITEVEYRECSAAELGVIRQYLKENPVNDVPPNPASKGILKEFETRFKDSGLPAVTN